MRQLVAGEDGKEPRAESDRKSAASGVSVSPVNELSATLPLSRERKQNW